MIGFNHNIEWNKRQKEVEEFLQSKKAYLRPDIYITHEDYDNESNKFKKIIEAYNKNWVNLPISDKISGMIFYPKLSNPTKCGRAYIEATTPAEGSFGLYYLSTLGTRDIIIENDSYIEIMRLVYDMSDKNISVQVTAEFKM